MNIHILDLGFLDLENAIAVFVVEGPQGLALIETGPASTLPHLEAALAKNGWQISDFQHVFLSHIHFDHAGAAWAFAEKGAQVYVHPKGLPHMAAPEKLYNSARMIYGEQMDTLWGEMRQIPEAQLSAPEHGSLLTVCGLQFRPWYTPGHAVHHIAWQVSDGTETVLFTGDVAGVKIENGPVMPPCPPPDIHVEDWRASIQLMRELPVETLYLTHFGKITEKSTHLDNLETRLISWANWMRPYAEQQADPAAIVPEFQAFVQAQLLEAGLSPSDSQRYEAANPSFMSVAGLMRYWKKVYGL